MKPLLIFEGTGQRIPDREKRQYDPRVVVKFQENAWCNEEMTVFWLRNMWKKPNMSGQPHDRLIHLIGRNTFMLIDENYIEFSISI